MEKLLKAKKWLIPVLVLTLLAIASGTVLAQLEPPKPPKPPKEETYTLTVKIEPEGAGEITLDPPQPSEGYELGTTITLTAEPSEGYEFNRWTGDAWGTSLTTTVVMTNDKEVTAHFKRVTPPAEEGKEEKGKPPAKGKEEEGKPPAWGKEEGKPPAEREEVKLEDIKKAIPEELMAQIEQFEKLREQLESELETAKAASETKIRDMEVAGLLAKEAAEVAEAGNLDKAEDFANRSLDLLVKAWTADREGAKTIEAYAKAINDLAEAIKNLMSCMYGGI